jgi:hypothetical protein
VRRLLALLGVLFAPTPAFADGPLGPNGSRIRTSEYAIDLTPGPLLLGTRALGLGGAYVAIAEGVDANGQNPAAPAVRSAWSTRHVDYDLGLGVLFPGSFSSSDFFNSGRSRTDLRRSNPREFALLTPAGNLQVGPWGAGLSVDLSRYGLMRRPNPERPGEQDLVRAQISVVRAQLARAVDHGQLVGGLGFVVTALDVTTRDEIVTRSGNIFTTRGINLEGGLLWRPNHQPFRIGLGVRAPVVTEIDSRGERQIAGDVVLGDPDSPEAIWLPRSVKRPWSADFGAALQLGPRPLNPPWVDPAERFRAVARWRERREQRRERRRAAGAGQVEVDAEASRDDERARLAEERLLERLRARYDRLPRRYVLLSAALHADGQLANSVGMSSFLQQAVDRTGESVTYSPRFGVETEAIPDWLKLRAGTYLEPSRFRGPKARAHQTLGFDVALVRWSAFGLTDDRTRWQLGGVLDLSRNYWSWGASVGVWR